MNRAYRLMPWLAITAVLGPFAALVWLVCEMGKVADLFEVSFKELVEA